MRERWSKATVILHWLAATLLVVNVLIGVSASGLAADASHRLVLSRLHAIGGAWLEYLRGSVRRAPELASSSWRGFHQALVFVLVGLVTAHVIGVIVEQLRRGRVLRRMAPFSR